MKKTLRELLNETIDSNYTGAVIDKLKKAEEMDEIDSVTFGLETDDNKIVKVYVRAEKEEEFKTIMSQKLGEIDSIEEVLNSIAQQDPDMIVDIEWPDVDTGDNSGLDDNLDEPVDNEESGKESLEDEVYNNDVEKADKDLKIKQNESIGSSFTKRLLEGDDSSLEEKKSAENKHPLKFTNSIQKLLYQAIIELGLSEAVLTNSSNKLKVVNGIRAAAIELTEDPARLNLIKSFVKKSISESKDDHILLESLDKDFLKTLLDKLFVVLDKDFPNVNTNGAGYKLINNTANYNTFFNRLQSSQITRISSINSILNNLNVKLDTIIKTIKQKNSDTMSSIENFEKN